MDRPTLTDRAALEAHRARAARSGLADFLHRAVADEIEERLSVVNRHFTTPAVVSGFPRLWENLVPRARQVTDTETLDLNAGAHDLVIHALALHWADDPVGQLVQCRRALAPDGLLICATFGGDTLRGLRQALAQAESEVTGGLSPRVAPMGEVRDLGALLQRAGFALPVADTMPYDVSYENAFRLWADLRAMGETNALADRHRAPPPRAMFLRAAELYEQAEGRADGRVGATFEVVTLTGWAPDASQPKPLRPGSATRRLSDALGTREEPLPGPADGEADSGNGRTRD
ncbi:methyltransferase domain-containing protein [Rhodovulum sp. 12E13]|uniref:methyltransferase domain-containing protein n=1 Tax=Rhodovulum sp. 12E13 TaxID=2203891 RepID=UPI000E1291F5|nr:methyltransferase domain-containing protein [Rhodovulum sp. 12E13]RDC73757.1 methyltransferase domain-containing protein [Rhodovulum sp. 12E13]